MFGSGIDASSAGTQERPIKGLPGRSAPRGSSPDEDEPLRSPRTTVTLGSARLP